MARQKKDSVILNVKVEREISEQLEAYCAETGQSKTVAVERMLGKELAEYFNQPEGQRIPR